MKRKKPIGPVFATNKRMETSELYSTRKKLSRKEEQARSNKRNPGAKLKPNHRASAKYAFKGGNIEALKALREAKENGLLVESDPVEIEQVIVPNLLDQLQNIRERKELQRTERKNSVVVDGFLYLITSPAYPEWVKVGQTSDYEARLSTYQTASPHADYCMIAIKYVEDRKATEAKFLELARLVFTVKGEWIKASVDDLLTGF